MATSSRSDDLQGAEAACGSGRARVLGEVRGRALRGLIAAVMFGLWAEVLRRRAIYGRTGRHTDDQHD